MTPERTCDAIHRYLDDELAPEERARFEAHLSGCPTCSQELDALRGLQQDFDQLSLPEAPPDLASELVRGVLERVGEAHPEDLGVRGGTMSGLHGFRWFQPVRTVLLVGFGLLAIGAVTFFPEELSRLFDPAWTSDAFLLERTQKLQSECSKALHQAHQSLEEGRIGAFQSSFSEAEHLRSEIQKEGRFQNSGKTARRDGFPMSNLERNFVELSRAIQDLGKLVSLETEADLERVQAEIASHEGTIEEAPYQTPPWSEHQRFFSMRTNAYTSLHLQLAVCLQNLGRRAEARLVLTRLLEAFEPRGADFFRACDRDDRNLTSSPEAVALLARYWRDNELVLQALRIRWEVVSSALPWAHPLVLEAFQDAITDFDGGPEYYDHPWLPQLELGDASREPFRSDLPRLIETKDKSLESMEEDLGVARQEVDQIDKVEEVLGLCIDAEELPEDSWSSAPRAACQGIRNDLLREDPDSLPLLARFAQGQSQELNLVKELRDEIVRRRSGLPGGYDPFPGLDDYLGSSSSVPALLEHSFKPRLRLRWAHRELENLQQTQEEWAQVPEPGDGVRTRGQREDL